MFNWIQEKYYQWKYQEELEGKITERSQGLSRRNLFKGLIAAPAAAVVAKEVIQKAVEEAPKVAAGPIPPITPPPVYYSPWVSAGPWLVTGSYVVTTANYPWHGTLYSGNAGYGQANYMGGYYWQNHQLANTYPG